MQFRSIKLFIHRRPLHWGPCRADCITTRPLNVSVTHVPPGSVSTFSARHCRTPIEAPFDSEPDGLHLPQALGDMTSDGVGHLMKSACSASMSLPLTAVTTECTFGDDSVPEPSTIWYDRLPPKRHRTDRETQKRNGKAARCYACTRREKHRELGTHSIGKEEASEPAKSFADVNRGSRPGLRQPPTGFGLASSESACSGG